MAGFSNYLETALLNHVFRTDTLTKPTNVYIGLFTATPSDAGGGTEVAGGSYARKAVSSADASWSAPADDSGAQEITNASAISFAESTGAWGTVSHFGIFDASSSGNLLAWGSLTTSRTVDAAGITLTIAAGDLSISLD